MPRDVTRAAPGGSRAVAAFAGVVAVLVLGLGPWMPEAEVGAPPVRLSIPTGHGLVGTDIAAMVVTVGRPSLAQLATNFAFRSLLASDTRLDSGPGDLDARWTAYRAPLVAAAVLRRQVPTAVMVMHSDDPGLHPGDVITSVHGGPVPDVEALFDAWFAVVGRSRESLYSNGDDLTRGYPVDVTVRRGTAVVATWLTKPWAVVSTTVAAAPALVPELADVSGNSMGLAMVLGLVDAATPRLSLVPSSDSAVAVTGALSDDSELGPPPYRVALVGHVGDKVAAAVDAGFTRVIVPAEQLPEARRGALRALRRLAASDASPGVVGALPDATWRRPEVVDLVGVRSVGEALAWLCSSTPPGGRVDPVCGLPLATRTAPPPTHRVVLPTLAPD